MANQIATFFESQAEGTRAQRVAEHLRSETVLQVSGKRVRIGIEAPMEVPVMRQEIYNEISQNNQAAAGSADAKLKIKQLVNN